MKISANSCVGFFLKARQNVCDPRCSSVGAKECLAVAVSAIAISILATVDLSTTLLLCVTIIPLFVLKQKLFIDIGASIVCLLVSTLVPFLGPLILDGFGSLNHEDFSTFACWRWITKHEVNKVAHNSLTGKYLETAIRWSPDDAPVTVKKISVLALSILTIPVLSAVDLTVSLLCCLTIFPLFRFGTGPLIDTAASIGMIVFSLFQVRNLWTANSYPAMARRDFLTGRPWQRILDVEHLWSQRSPDLDIPAWYPLGILERCERISWEGGHSFEWSTHLSLEALCERLEQAATIQEKFRVRVEFDDINELLRSTIDDGLLRLSRVGCSDDTAQRLVAIIKKFKLNIRYLIQESLEDLPIPLLKSFLQEPECRVQAGYYLVQGDLAPRGKRSYFTPKTFDEIMQEAERYTGTMRENAIYALGIRYCHLYFHPLFQLIFTTYPHKRSVLSQMGVFLEEGAPIDIQDRFGRDLITALLMQWNYFKRVNRNSTDLDNLRLEKKISLELLFLLLEYGASLHYRWKGYSVFEWAETYPDDIIEHQQPDAMVRFLDGWKENASLQEVVESIKVAMVTGDGHPEMVKRLIPTLQKAMIALPYAVSTASLTDLVKTGLQANSWECLNVLFEQRLGVECVSLVTAKVEQDREITLFVPNLSEESCKAAADLERNEENDCSEIYSTTFTLSTASPVQKKLFEFFQRYKEETTQEMHKAIPQLPQSVADTIFDYWNA